MHKRLIGWAIVGVGLLVWVVAVGCGGGGGVPAERTYVGSGECQGCHAQQYARMLDSGHPYKLRRVQGGQAPTYPHSSVPNPPGGYTWNDVTYVIGGYGWKARFIDTNGYVMTGQAVQYNLANQQWVAYDPDVPAGTKPYDCGACHTTGWVATGAEGPHQDNLPGMYGTFSEPGVTCEACHGPGSRHVQTRSALDIDVDSSAAFCGLCHFRDSQHRIAAKGGFIQHHEQYDELISAGHSALRCVDCHSPHKGTRYDTVGDALVASCESCHATQAANIAHNSLPDCIDCHLARATKSAVAQNVHQADVRTHIFKIHTAEEGKDAMWYEQDGATFAHGFVTLDFACYGCHKDESGVGGQYSTKTLAELSARAVGMHAD